MGALKLKHNFSYGSEIYVLLPVCEWIEVSEGDG